MKFIREYLERRRQKKAIKRMEEVDRNFRGFIIKLSKQQLAKSEEGVVK